MQRLTDLMINSFNAIGESDSAKYYGLLIKSMFPAVEADISENDSKFSQVFDLKGNLKYLALMLFKLVHLAVKKMRKD